MEWRSPWDRSTKSISHNSNNRRCNDKVALNKMTAMLTQANLTARLEGSVKVDLTGFNSIMLDLFRMIQAQDTKINGLVAALNSNKTEARMEELLKASEEKQKGLWATNHTRLNDIEQRVATRETPRPSADFIEMRESFDTILAEHKRQLSLSESRLVRLENELHGVKSIAEEAFNNSSHAVKDTQQLTAQMLKHDQEINRLHTMNQISSTEMANVAADMKHLTSSVSKKMDEPRVIQLLRELEEIMNDRLVEMHDVLNQTHFSMKMKDLSLEKELKKMEQAVTGLANDEGTLVGRSHVRCLLCDRVKGKITGAGGLEVSGNHFHPEASSPNLGKSTTLIGSDGKVFKGRDWSQSPPPAVDNNTFGTRRSPSTSKSPSLSATARIVSDILCVSSVKTRQAREPSFRELVRAHKMMMLPTTRNPIAVTHFAPEEMRSHNSNTRQKGKFVCRRRDVVFLLAVFFVVTLFYIETRAIQTETPNTPLPPKKRPHIIDPDRPNQDTDKPVPRTRDVEEGDSKSPIIDRKPTEQERKQWREKRISQAKESDCPLKKITRDYKTQPVVNLYSGWGDCDIPCVGSGDSSHIDIGSGASQCTKSVSKTMENVGESYGDDSRMMGNTKLDADVTMQYFSWAEYNFMRPMQKKVEKSMAVAMISNCGPAFRLQYIKDLQAAGVTVDTFGSCYGHQKSNDNVGDRLNSKISMIGGYKFVMSFENSETEDYVTEKLFGPYVSGSVPVYHGAPNGKIFGMDKSMLFVNDYKSPAELAKLIKYLDSNDTAYSEYVRWKEEGPDQRWISFIDLSIVHSACRFCIRSADIDRKQVGEVITGPYSDENIDQAILNEGRDTTLFKVRERGTFYLRWFYVRKGDGVLSQLRKLILQRYADAKPSVGEIFSIYKLWDRKKTPITEDDELNLLAEETELEVIFTRPASLDRASYTEWYYKKHGLTLPADWKPH
ncbi:hypothetical protein PROFUN_12212 [Planoprotostelium fungivorum]|uniref:Fucosyltransferase n=1 Tax=Planoprotostelium fungivorum TaxID=1890364 RepID=A0A2P6N857_9EUKA|nr:hypothetical protein PROFUN_12212 [Planoprotostelium fungivorum]